MGKYRMFSIPIEPVLGFFLVFARVGFFFAFLPIYGDAFAPNRIRILLSLVVALLFAPLVEVNLAVFPQTVWDLAGFLLPEALLGLSLGFVGRLFFAAVQFAGSVMGHELGFQMADILDPTQQARIPVLGQMLFIGSLLVFLGINGDHLFFQALAQSFRVAPLGELSIPDRLGAFFSQSTSRMFVIAVKLSMPIIAAIFVTNVGMGMLGKAVPSINVFVERFPIAILLGFFVLSVVSGFFVQLVVDQLGVVRDELTAVLQLFGR
jgi:flagellar biosynthetic protein FliR